MQSKIVFASLLAGASANLLAARQAGNPLSDLSKQCVADLQSLSAATDLPAYPTAVLEDIVSAAMTLTDSCAYTPTGTIASEITSFASAAESWASKHTDLASKVEKDCGRQIQNIADQCTKNGGSGSSSGASKPTGTTSSGDAKNTSGGDGKSAAANGPAAAGALMIAALGAVALL